MDMIILYIIYIDLSTSIFVFHSPYGAMQHQTPVSLATARPVLGRGCYKRWRCVGSRKSCLVLLRPCVTPSQAEASRPYIVNQLPRETGYQWRWPQYGGHQAQFAEGSIQTERGATLCSRKRD